MLHYIYFDGDIISVLYIPRFQSPDSKLILQEEWGNWGCYWLDKKARVEVSSGTFMKYIEDANDLASLVSWI